MSGICIYHISSREEKLKRNNRLDKSKQPEDREIKTSKVKKEKKTMVSFYSK